MDMLLASDPHQQLRSLYMALLNKQEHFDEFKQLLSLYTPNPGDTEGEPSEAAQVRQRLVDRVREWTGTPFNGISAAQMLLWRTIIVDERINIALSPWKESNHY